MRVLIIVPWGEALGGAETMLLTLLRHAGPSDPKYEVAFLQRGPFAERVAALGIPVHTTDAGRLRQVHRYFRAVVWLRRLIDREKFDAVLAWSAKVHLYGSVAGALSRTKPPRMWWQHGVPNGHWLDRMATALPAAAVGCSSLASRRAQNRIWPRRNTFAVHPGVDVVPPGGALDVRRRLGLGAHDLVLGMVGRFEAWKGQLEFVQTLGLLRAGGLDVRGILVGGDAYDLNPGYLQAVKAAVTALELEPYCVFTGHVADARPFMGAMDVMVSASNSEPFGIVLIEAMALGVPVVAVASGGPMEILRHGVDGLLADSPSPRSLAEPIRQLVKDPALRQRLAREGRRTYEQRFTGAHMAAKIGASLTQALEGSR